MVHAKRLLSCIVAVVAGAIAISTAFDVIDIEQSTIEDGPQRWWLVAGSAVVFLACLAWLVASLSAGRHRRRDESKAVAARPIAFAPSTTPPLATPPSDAPPSDAPPSDAPLFGRAKQPRISSASGLFDRDGTDDRPAEPLLVEVAEPELEEPLQLRSYTPEHIDATIDRERSQAIDELVDVGSLSTEGPLTPEEIRTMLFIALSTEQLRAVLHDARRDEPEVPSVDALPPGGELPVWVEVAEGSSDEEDPPSTGYLYVTGG